jgi:Ribonuclease G/E
LTEGSLVAVDVLAGPRRHKSVAVRFVEAADGRPRLLRSAPSLEEQLLSWAPAGIRETGAGARGVADEAEEEALALEHALPSGGRIFIEPTQALIAIDVDLAAARGGGARRLIAQVNGEALVAAARLLRLKALGGLVAVDLAGRGHDGAELTAVARAAFAADGSDVSFGSISRFGVLELALPWRRRPIADVLLGADGQISVLSAALRLMRRIESQAGPGERLLARCAPEVAAASAPLTDGLRAKIGARFTIEAVSGMKRDQLEVHPF